MPRLTNKEELKKKIAKAQEAYKPSWQYRPHYGRIGCVPVRVWRTDWYSDQFEILSAEEFKNLEALSARLNIPIDIAGDD